MTEDNSKFLDALYFGIQNGEGFEPALDILCADFNLPSAVLLDFDPARSAVSFSTSVGVFSGAAALRYQRDYAAIDPAPPAFMRQSTGTIISTYNLLPEETRRPGAFFSDFFRPLGLEECLGGVIASHNGRFAMVGLHRSPDRVPFDTGDTQRLAALSPHIARAIQLRRHFLELEQRAGALEDIVNRLAPGIAIFDAERRCIELNASMERIVRDQGGLSLDAGGALRALDRIADTSLRHLERNVREGGAGGIAIVPKLKAVQPYSVLVAPYAGSPAAFSERRNGHGVLFVVHDPHLRGDPSPHLLAAALDLPDATARVVAALASGEDLEEIARRLGISINTVRYHLRLAYARTGTKRQGELIRMAVLLLRDLSDYG